MKAVAIEVPSLSLGTVSLRRSWTHFGFYLAGLAFFTLLVVHTKNGSSNNSLNRINLRFQYFEATDFRDLALNREHSYLALKTLFAERNAQLKKACKKYSRSQSHQEGVSPGAVDRARWFYMRKPNFMFCMIPKVASTSLSGFILSNHQKGGHQGNKVLKTLDWKEVRSDKAQFIRGVPSVRSCLNQSGLVFSNEWMWVMACPESTWQLQQSVMCALDGMRKEEVGRSRVNFGYVTSPLFPALSSST